MYNKTGGDDHPMLIAKVGRKISLFAASRLQAPIAARALKVKSIGHTWSLNKQPLQEKFTRNKLLHTLFLLKMGPMLPGISETAFTVKHVSANPLLILFPHIGFPSRWKGPAWENRLLSDTSSSGTESDSGSGSLGSMDDATASSETGSATGPTGANTVTCLDVPSSLVSQ